MLRRHWQEDNEKAHSSGREEETRQIEVELCQIAGSRTVEG